MTTEVQLVSRFTRKKVMIRQTKGQVLFGNENVTFSDAEA
jgi:hypothetical protein